MVPTFRRRIVLKNIGWVVLYGIVFHILRNGFQSSAFRNRLPDIPEIKLDYNSNSPYNSSKVALLIENRPSNLLAPLLLQFMAVVPPDWKFRFMGTISSVAKLNFSAAIRAHVATGRLDLTFIPEGMNTGGQEQISGFLTNLRVFEEVLWPAEWLLLFQTDSMICGNHRNTLDKWLEYSWVGAPWVKHSTWGGNGGFSLRRVSSIIQILRHQNRLDNSDPEDVWLTERIGHLPGAKTATGEESMKFSVEMIWADEPLGYHIGGSGTYLFRDVWGRDDRRDRIYEYCPELKMTLDMDVEEIMAEEYGICEGQYI